MSSSDIPKVLITSIKIINKNQIDMSVTIKITYILTIFENILLFEYNYSNTSLGSLHTWEQKKKSLEFLGRTGQMEGSDGGVRWILHFWN